MATGIGSVQVRKERGRIVLQGLGLTPRGQKYIKNTLQFVEQDPKSPEFKREMAELIEKLFA